MVKESYLAHIYGSQELAQVRASFITNIILCVEKKWGIIRVFPPCIQFTLQQLPFLTFPQVSFHIAQAWDDFCHIPFDSVGHPALRFTNGRINLYSLN